MSTPNPLASTATGYTAPQLPSSFNTAGLDPGTVAGMNVFMRQYLPQVMSTAAMQGLGQGAQAEAGANAAAQAYVPLLQSDIANRQRQEALGLQGIGLGMQGYAMQQQAGQDVFNMGQQGYQNLLNAFTPAALPRDVQMQQSAANQNELARLQGIVESFILGPIGGSFVPLLGSTVSSSGGK